MSYISKISVGLLILASCCILSAVYLPIWSIYLDAPQYPEGLGMYIYANKLGGDVEIINGLNHYIGMKTLHAEEFIEFTVLPYIIGFFAFWTLACAIFFKTKRSVVILLVSFMLFGILAMYDFWRWEYDYGHNLNPNAAIIVPGMAYQPPLIGFKQLLNFGAFSTPALGGWLMLIGGILIGLVFVIESGWLGKKKNYNVRNVSMLTLIFYMQSCVPTGPEPIQLYTDTCAFCKMNIADGHFGAELITSKGRVYKFDDISCLLSYKSENNGDNIKAHFVHHWPQENQLIPAENAVYVQSDKLKSPMSGNIAAFKSETEAAEFQSKLQGKTVSWSQLVQTFQN